MYTKFSIKLPFFFLLSILFLNLNILAQGSCDNDTIAPMVVCQGNINLSIEEYENDVVIQAAALDNGSSDNCTSSENLNFRITLNGNTSTPPVATFLKLAEGEYTIYLWVGDEDNNWNICQGHVIIGQGCSEDLTPPTALCFLGMQVVVEGDPAQVTISAASLNQESFDNCTAPEDLFFRIVGGTNSTTPPTTETIEFTTDDLGTQDVTLWVGDMEGNWSNCITNVQVTLPSDTRISGKVFIENNGNCELDENEQGMEAQSVAITGNISNQTYYAVTDANGFYSVNVPNDTEDTAYTIKLATTLNYGMNCPNSQIISSPLAAEINLNIPVELPAACHLLTIDVGTPYLEHCAANTYYVNYCNYGTATVENAMITLVLPETLTLDSAMVDFIPLGDNRFSISVGQVEAGACGSFEFYTFLDCEAVVGQAHRVAVEIIPSSNCESINPDWSGASIQIIGICDEENEEVIFEIINVGDGDMDDVQQYIIVEEIILLKKEDFKLDSGESLMVTLPADGTTWHIGTEQVPFHPGFSQPSVTIEGCGGVNTLGIATMFHEDEADAAHSIDYQQSILSPVWNELQVYPAGYGEENYIKSSVMLEYLISFTNDFDETAKQVVIEFELSEYLNLSTIRPGISNGVYEFELEDNIARFIFNDLATLTDDFGFVKFGVAQQANNAGGTVIQNQAVIYVDNDILYAAEPTFHTVGKNFIEVTSSTNHTEFVNATLQVFPNPVIDILTLQIIDYQLIEGVFKLFNTKGQLLTSFTFEEQKITIENLDLPTGLYFYQIEDEGVLVQSGKLAVK